MILGCPRAGRTVDKAAFCIRRSKGLGNKADKHEPAALERVNKRTRPVSTGRNREDGRSLFCRFLTATSTHRYAWTSNLFWVRALTTRKVGQHSITQFTFLFDAASRIVRIAEHIAPSFIKLSPPPSSIIRKHFDDGPNNSHDESQDDHYFHQS